jgi:hypothetical protein
MGNDGGSIPTRRELVKEAARNKTTSQLKETQAEQQEYYWTTDPITNEPLEPPIVSDSNGRLYKKESVLKLLTVDESINVDEAAKATAGAIKTLKDVVEVKFEPDTSASVEKAANGERKNRWLCPITNKPLGPGSKAVYLVPCGHAFSSVAIKEVAEEKCLQCGEAYAPNDVIPIVPTNEEDIARLILRVKALKEKGLTHSLKKGKKRKAKDVDEPVTSGYEIVPNLVPTKQQNGNGSGTSTPTNGNGIKNSATASLAAKVVEEQERKKRKMDKNENLKGLFSSRDQKTDVKNSKDFMTRGFTIAK